ncbi:MAG: DsbE family thiol:disulfide interchange protein [Pseudomonadales bacterium]
MTRLVRFIPVAIFACIAGFLVFGLSNDPTHLPSAVVGKPLPEFQLIDVEDESLLISQDDLVGSYSLINFWGTWCQACHVEHPFLLELAAQGVVIYGVDYKDQLAPAKRWLNELGNPYQRVIFDARGSLGFDMGVTGAPETFLVDPNGVVLHRYQGVLDRAVWEAQFLPLINQ